jgi:ABC-type polar amino acid transport system ATPase subunit
MLTGTLIRKSYSGKQILEDIDVAIEPGKITTLIGPSGSGKSSLLRALSLLDPPDSGVVELDEIKYIFPTKARGKQVTPWPKLTTVFQQLFLWPHLTIRQNIMLPIEHRKGASSRIDALMDLLDLQGFRDRYPNQVSLGQRQRAAIARALALEPKYLLLDEITSSLDVEYVSALLTHLKALRNSGVGILLITHLIGFAKSSADQILFMDNGRIVERGSPDILSHPSSDRLRTFLSLMITAS